MGWQERRGENEGKRGNSQKKRNLVNKHAKRRGGELGFKKDITAAEGFFFCLQRLGEKRTGVHK